MKINRYSIGCTRHPYQAPSLRIGAVITRLPRKTERAVCNKWRQILSGTHPTKRYACSQCPHFFSCTCHLSPQHDIISGDEQGRVLAARGSDGRQKHGTEVAKLGTELREGRNLHR